MSNHVLTGALTGLVIVMSGAMLNAGSGKSEAAQPPLIQADNGPRFSLAVGGTAQGMNDLLWVLHEHKPNPALKRDESKILKPDVVSLCLYRTENGKKMQLVATRDIAYDMDVVCLGNSDPTPRDILAELKKIEK